MGVKVTRLGDEAGYEEREEGYSGVSTIWLVPERGDLACFSSRVFRMEPGGHTSMHAHAREHVTVVIKGTCLVECGSEAEVMGEGSVVNIPPDVAHRFSNRGNDRLMLLVMNLIKG